METEPPIALPVDNPAFLVGLAIVAVICFVLYESLKRFDQWAASRGLRWRSFGNSAYLWPEDDDGAKRSDVPGSVIALIAALVLLVALLAVQFLAFE